MLFISRARLIVNVLCHTTGKVTGGLADSYLPYTDSRPRNAAPFAYMFPLDWPSSRTKF